MASGQGNGNRATTRALTAYQQSGPPSPRRRQSVSSSLAARRAGRWWVDRHQCMCAAIARQVSAHVLQASTHASIPPMRWQLSAQAAHTCAHTAHSAALNFELLNCKFADVWQISAQFIISRKCVGSTCEPPDSIQWFRAVCRQTRWQLEQASIQGSICVCDMVVCMAHPFISNSVRARLGERPSARLANSATSPGPRAECMRKTGNSAPGLLACFDGGHGQRTVDLLDAEPDLVA